VEEELSKMNDLKATDEENKKSRQDTLGAKRPIRRNKKSVTVSQRLKIVPESDSPEMGSVVQSRQQSPTNTMHETLL
jgi:hypothetical protein